MSVMTLSATGWFFVSSCFWRSCASAVNDSISLPGAKSSQSLVRLAHQRRCSAVVILVLDLGTLPKNLAGVDPTVNMTSIVADLKTGTLDG